MAGVKQPDDRSHFILPDLGEGVHEAELIKWRVNEGDAVKEHQTIAEMETDKAVVEVPSPWTGVISQLCGKAGDIINVGSVLVRYKVGGAAPAPSPVAKAAAPAPAAKAPTPKAESNEDAGTVVGSVSGTLGVPSRFARKPEHEAASQSSSKSLATPAVRRIARDLGVDIQRVNGTGRGGRVTAGDVERRDTRHHHRSRHRTTGAHAERLAGRHQGAHPLPWCASQDRAGARPVREDRRALHGGRSG